MDVKLDFVIGKRVHRVVLWSEGEGCIGRRAKGWIWDGRYGFLFFDFLLLGSVWYYGMDITKTWPILARASFRASWQTTE